MISTKTFPNQEKANLIRDCVRRAVMMWHLTDSSEISGPLNFVEVYPEDKVMPTVMVQYESHQPPNALADAELPDHPWISQAGRLRPQRIRIYSDLFWYGLHRGYHIGHIIAHEVGHILGLAHEHPSRDDLEEYPSQDLNTLRGLKPHAGPSVMAVASKQSSDLESDIVTEDDLEGMKWFYNYKEPYLGGFKLVDIVPLGQVPARVKRQVPATTRRGLPTPTTPTVTGGTPSEKRGRNNVDKKLGGLGAEAPKLRRPSEQTRALLEELRRKQRASGVISGSITKR